MFYCNFLLGYGVCVVFDICICDLIWYGVFCSLVNCFGVNECFGKGDCILLNICECFLGYDGVVCNMIVLFNLYVFIFSIFFYNLILLENVFINMYIFKVNVSDVDMGRNVQLFFLLDNFDGVNLVFIIDSFLGKIFILMNFDYEGLFLKFFKFKIMVLDDGVLRKLGFVFVYIIIRDENDNCFVFNLIKVKSFNILQNVFLGIFLIIVLVDDIDSGLNGEVRYSVSINERVFVVDEKSGEVIIFNGLIERSYCFVVIVCDFGVLFCFC